MLQMWRLAGAVARMAMDSAGSPGRPSCPFLVVYQGAAAAVPGYCYDKMSPTASSSEMPRTVKGADAVPWCLLLASSPCLHSTVVSTVLTVLSALDLAAKASSRSAQVTSRQTDLVATEPTWLAGALKAPADQQLQHTAGGLL
jgi:hypothetical protein